MDSFDLIVIGSGPAGYVSAIRSAQLGLKTAIIEKEKTLGGTCLNVGCIPSKALLSSSELFSKLLHDAQEHGIKCKPSVDFQQMMKRKTDVVKSLVNGVSGLMQKNKITVYQGVGRFVDSRTIAIGNTKIYGKNILIATGSAPMALPFLPFDEERVVSSTGALSLSKVPKRLVVIGAGVIGVELASVYSRLGSEVTIVEMLDHICPAMDSEVSRTLVKILKKQEMTFLLSTKVEEAKVEKKKITLTLDSGDKLKADVVLVAVGRRPYTEGLGLDNVGIETTPQGFIPVDGLFRTRVPHIYAVGDVIEGVMLAHKASEEGIVAVETIAGHTASIDYLTVPNVIYTHPEVAAVGMTEEEAKSAGLEVMIGRFAFKGNGRARCSLETEGVVKVIGEKSRGHLLGMHIIGAQASELIAEGMVAIQQRATVEQLANAPQAHPTLSEAIKEACLNALGRTIHA